MKPEDIAWSPSSLGKTGDAGDVKVRWLGTAGFAVEHAGHVLLIDPYVTRASLRRCVMAPLVPDRAAIQRYAPRADAIVAGHTHFDHVLDVPDIALATGARVFGSRSASTLCLARGVAPEKVENVEPEAGQPPAEREIGPFRLRFVPSAHSALLLGKVPLPGDIADCTDVPLRTQDYRCGAVFGVEIKVAGRVLYHLGSAELVERHVDVRNVDLLLMCVAGWTTSARLPERVAHTLAPGAVLFSHWDDFLRPLDQPLQVLPAMRFAQLVDRLGRAAPSVRMGTLDALGEVWI